MRSTDGGLTVDNITGNLTDSGGPASNFIAPIHLDAQRRLLAGGSSLWRNNDPLGPTNTWNPIKVSIPGNPIAAIATNPGNANEIWVAHNSPTANGSGIFRTINGGGSWEEIFWPGRPARLATRITIDAEDPTRAFFTFGGYAADNVWLIQTLAGGGYAFTSFTLPVAAPARDVEFHPTDPQCLFVATEVGLLSSPDFGTTWVDLTPANVTIDEMFWSAGYLYLVTHGRGIFRQSPFPQAAQTSVGVPCELGGPLTPGPVLTTGDPLLGTSVTLQVTNGQVGGVARLRAGIRASHRAAGLWVAARPCRTVVHARARSRGK